MARKGISFHQPVQAKLPFVPEDAILAMFRGERKIFGRVKVQWWEEWEHEHENFLKTQSVVLPGIRHKSAFALKNRCLNQYRNLLAIAPEPKIKNRRIVQTHVIGTLHILGTPQEFSGGQYYKGGVIIQKYIEEYYNDQSNLKLKKNNNPGQCAPNPKGWIKMYIGTLTAKTTRHNVVYYGGKITFPLLKTVEIALFRNKKEDGRSENYPDWSINTGDIRVGSAWRKETQKMGVFLSGVINSPIFPDSRVPILIEMDKDKPNEIFHVSWIGYQNKKEPAQDQMGMGASKQPQQQAENQPTNWPPEYEPEGQPVPMGM